MKQQIPERARSTVEGFLHQQCANTTLGVLSVDPEMDGYGDEFGYTSPTMTAAGAKGLPDSLARIKMKGERQMGEIVASMKLENTEDRGVVRRGLSDESTIRRATVDGVVDTGAVMLMLPEDVVSRLGLETQSEVLVTYANEYREIRSVAGPVTVRIGDRGMIAECVVGPPSSEPLIGQIVLEALDLVADCRNQTLGPRPESPDRPLLKMK